MIYTSPPPTKSIFTLLQDTGDKETKTGSTSLLNIKSEDIPANALGNNGVILIEAAGGVSGNNGSKTFKLHWNGEDIFQWSMAANASPKYWQFWAQGYCQNANNLQKWECFQYNLLVGGLMGDYIETTKNIEQGNRIYMYGQLANAADSMWVDKFRVYLVPQD